MKRLKLKSFHCYNEHAVCNSSRIFWAEIQPDVFLELAFLCYAENFAPFFLQVNVSEEDQKPSPTIVRQTKNFTKPEL